MPRRKGDSDDKPRGKMTSYAFFVQTCREEHKRKHPDETVQFSEFSKKCADRWKTMSEKEKKRFNQMAEADKKRFELEMANYTPTATPGDDKGGKKKKKKRVKDPNAPKRAMSAFFWFSQDERGRVKAANPDFGVGDTAKELSRRWAVIKPELKSKFESMAENDRARYDKEKKEYQETLASEKNGLVKSQLAALADDDADSDGVSD